MRGAVFALLAGVLTMTPAPGGEFADSWFLVRLESPIDVGREVDWRSGRTGFPELDALILDAGVERIEHALPVSGRSSRFPKSFSRHGLDRTYRFHVPRGSDIRGLIDRFSRLPGVELAEPDYVGQGGARFPNDPLFGSQYGFDQPSDADVDGPEAWDIATGGGTVLAVLDTGADSDHPDLSSKLVAGFDFVNVDADPEDDHGHGTNVSSIAAAASDNNLGVVGACWDCAIMPLKVLDASNFGFYSDWADAMVWATDAGARVINLSAGGTSPSATLLAGVQYAWDAGVIHVSITHNDDANLVRYPGAYAETITVGATDDLDQRADPFCYSATSGSNYGAEIDVVAPGELILGTALGGGYSSWCGTSQAAPLVAGLVGIMRTVYPSVGREQARYLLQVGAEDQVGRPTEDTPGFDIYHGWGRVNMERSLLATEASASLRVDGVSATRVYFQTPSPLADSYDFIRGSLSTILEDAAGVDLGSVICLEDDSADADTLGNEDLASPAAGEVFFYLGRFNAARGPGWYGGSSANRDREPADGGCSGCGNGVREDPEICDGADLGGETCQTQGFTTGTLGCSASCDALDTSGCSTCGNGVCETLGGEDCLSCPDDCNGDQSGPPPNRYCCGGGGGENPVGCEDPRCTGNGNTCSP